MSGLYLYAIVGRTPGERIGRGLQRAPLRVVRCGQLFVAVEDVEDHPAVTPKNLRAHDRVVRRLADAANALLPVRFGTVVPSAAALARMLSPRQSDLRDALSLVRGREQMTLRVYGRRDSENVALVTARVEDSPTDGPGARYLAGRQRAERERTSVPEIDGLRPALGRFVRAERVERPSERAVQLARDTDPNAPPLVASVHHLIDRGAARAYKAAVRRATPAATGIQVLVRGPWPAYAFAPEAVA